MDDMDDMDDVDDMDREDPMDAGVGRLPRWGRGAAGLR